MKMKQREAPLNRAEHLRQLSLLPDICPLCNGTKLIPKIIRDTRRKSGFRREFLKCIRCN